MNSKFLSKVVRYYIIITTICFLLFELAPIQSFLLGTPFYSFQKYLGIIGVGLVGLDILFNRLVLKGKYVVYLYALVIVATISSVLTMSYGIKHNLFDVAWSVIFFALFYSYLFSFEKESLKRDLKLIYNISAIVWVIACIVSIFSFLFDTGYYAVTNNYYETIVTRQGFLENRLFGIFISVHTSASVAALLLMYGVFDYIKSRKVWTLIVNIVLYIYIVLSGTRSSLVALLVASLVVIFYCVIKKRSSFNLKSIALAIVISIASVVLIYSSTVASKKVLSEVPKTNLFYNNQQSYRMFLNKFDSIIIDSDEAKQDTKMKKILERSDVSSENYTNNRYAIWQDYLSLSKDFGLFGLSPNNFSKYIKDNYNDKYIVTYVKENMPEKYDNGEVYQPHNSFIVVFASTGFLGIIALFVFMFFVLKDTFKYAIKNIVEKFNYPFLISISLVIFLFMDMIFDGLIFFEGDIITCIFWLALSYMVREVNNI